MVKYGSLVLGLVLVVAACGGSDTADTTTTTEATTTTTAAVTTTTAAPTSTVAGSDSGPEPIVPGEDPDADEIANVYAVVFDSTTTFDDKADLIADSEGLEGTVEAYTAAGGAVGNIFLEAKAVAVDGDDAVVIYDLQFGGNVFQADQEGTAVRTDGSWKVSREYFCTVMELARVSCS